MPHKIKIDPSLKLYAGTMLEAEAPSAGDIKEHILGIALGDDPHHSQVLPGLVQAYIGALIEQAEEDEEGEEVSLVSDGNGAAEKLYRQYVVKGYREAMRKVKGWNKSHTDDEVYENSDWYNYGKMVWPAQLLAEIAYMRAYKDGRNWLQMCEYARAVKEAESENA